MAFICGSFRSQEEDEIDAICPTSSPRKTSRRNMLGSRRSKNATNPYSDRGLEKFEALMADLDQQRQKIMIQKGSEDVSMIKFIYRNFNEVKPIVVKIRDQGKHDSSSSIESTLQLEQKEDVAFVKGVKISNVTEQRKMVKPLVDESQNKKIILGHWRKKLGEWWSPSYYFPLIMIMILVLLMFSGRSFAILCTSIGWYTVPIINQRLNSSKQSKNSRTSRKRST